MSAQEPQFVFVMSTAGAVMNQLLANDFLKGHVHSIVADQQCDAIAKAAGHGMPVQLIDEPSSDTFCDKLAAYMDSNGIDYVISFYTQFYSKRFRDRFRDRIVNPHPSLLPAFKGLKAFDDGVAYFSKIVGTTIEFPRDLMDEGAIVVQTVCPVDWNQDIAVTRHRIFVQQCKSILQMVKWIVDDRVRIDGNQVLIEGATYGSHEYSPALDFDQAIAWQIPMPKMAPSRS